MAQPTNIVSRIPSASVSANSRPGPLRVAAAPSLPVNRYLGKASKSRKKKRQAYDIFFTAQDPSSKCSGLRNFHHKLPRCDGSKHPS
jgi:hypothetical protein